MKTSIHGSPLWDGSNISAVIFSNELTAHRVLVENQGVGYVIHRKSAEGSKEEIILIQVILAFLPSHFFISTCRCKMDEYSQLETWSSKM